jgi:DNA-binding MarR family transcriptional regulator
MTENVSKRKLIEHVLQLSEKTFRELIPLVSKEWLQLDLTMPQLKVVLILVLNGSARMSAIASQLGVSLATATGVVDRLVEQGIVLRHDQPGDRRVVLCSLSDKGQKLIGGLWRLHQEEEREMLEAMKLHQLQSLKQALEVILQAELVMNEARQRSKKDGFIREGMESAEVSPSTVALRTMA